LWTKIFIYIEMRNAEEFEIVVGVRDSSIIEKV
jgi:hypothetical protein